MFACPSCGEVLSDQEGHICSAAYPESMDGYDGEQGFNQSQESDSVLTSKKIRILLNGGRLQLKTTINCHKCRGEFKNKAELDQHSSLCGQGRVGGPITNFRYPSTNQIPPVDFIGPVAKWSTPMEMVKFECEVCGDEFSDAAACRKHIIDEHLEPNDQTNRSVGDVVIVALESGTVAGLRAYNNDQNGDVIPLLICPRCPSSFEHRFELFEHSVNVHGKRILYECTMCEKIFARRSELDHHVQSHLNLQQSTSTGQIEKYECRVCGKRFLFESYLRRHSATHSSECGFVCNLCGVELRSQGALVLHKAKHTGDQLHPCTKCGKVFPFKSYLERHNKTHAAGPAPCPYCNEVFVVQSQLEKHIALDHNQHRSALSCPHCDRKFVYPSYLERHLSVHHQSLDHECPICRRQFSSRSALLRHLQCHMPVPYRPAKLFKCKICQSAYRYESGLAKHMHQVHRDPYSMAPRARANSDLSIAVEESADGFGLQCDASSEAVDDGLPATIKVEFIGLSNSIFID